jgi:hypothetical protein
VNNQLTVIGPYPPPPGFVAGSVVRWNGSDRPTTSNGSVNGLTAQISASDIAAAGTAVVTVFNPGPGGGLSNSLTFTITTGAVDPQSIAVDPTGKFAYVMNGGCSGGIGGYVSMYTINPTTGALASIGPPVWTHDYGYYPGLRDRSSFWQVRLRDKFGGCLRVLIMAASRCTPSTPRPGP